MKKILDFPNNQTVDAEAADWLVRLDGDIPLSIEERGELSEWVNRSHAHGKRIQQLATSWDKMSVLTKLAVPIGQPHPRRPWLPSPSWSRARLSAVTISAAAVIALIVGVLYWHFPDPMMETNGFFATAIGDQTSTTLSDGTVISLNTNTQIRAAYDGNFRDIYLLQGEAHFSVARNDGLPFRVFAGIGRIDAVGTAFSVHLRGDLIDVAVTEGLVELASTSGLPDIATEDVSANRLGTLVAGQTATIARQPDPQANSIATLSGLRIVEDRDMSRIMSWRDGVLIFSGETLEDVVNEISRYTTVSIELADPDIRSLRIGGRFPVGETDTMLTALEYDFGLRVTRMSSSHVVVSAGNPR